MRHIYYNTVIYTKDSVTEATDEYPNQDIVTFEGCPVLFPDYIRADKNARGGMYTILIWDFIANENGCRVATEDEMAVGITYEEFNELSKKYENTKQ